MKVRLLSAISWLGVHHHLLEAYLHEGGSLSLLWKSTPASYERELRRHVTRLKRYVKASGKATIDPRELSPADKAAFKTEEFDV